MMLKKIRNLIILVLAAWLFLFSFQKGWFPKLHKKPPQILKLLDLQQSIRKKPGFKSVQNSFAKVAEVLSPAVVNISVKKSARQTTPEMKFYFGDPHDFFFRPPKDRPQEYLQRGTGSGVIIDPDGYILTNAHVVLNAKEVVVTLYNGKTVKAKTIGLDDRTDLAILKIPAPYPLPYALLGESSTLRVGEWILAIGSPFGLQQTFTTGIISARRQSLNIEGRMYRDLLQTDAAINKGNSGGPLVNIYGEVVGINSAIYAPTGVFSGIGFAIPINEAKRILRDLIEKGSVERSWIGIEITKVDEVLARQFGLDKPEGALINKIYANTPADKAGLKRGDIITKIGREKISGPLFLQDIVSQTPPNTTVEITVLRNKEWIKLPLLTEKLPESPQLMIRRLNEKPDTFKWLGATFSEMTKTIEERKKGILETQEKGVFLINVPPKSLARDAGLREGDTLHAINRQPTPSIKKLKEAVENVDPKKGLVFDVSREGKSFYLSYKSLH